MKAFGIVLIAAIVGTIAVIFVMGYVVKDSSKETASNPYTPSNPLPPKSQSPIGVITDVMQVVNPLNQTRNNG